MLLISAAIVIVALGLGLGLYFGLRTNEDENSEVNPLKKIGVVVTNGIECASIGR